MGYCMTCHVLTKPGAAPTWSSITENQVFYEQRPLELIVSHLQTLEILQLQKIKVFLKILSDGGRGPMGYNATPSRHGYALGTATECYCRRLLHSRFRSVP